MSGEEIPSAVRGCQVGEVRRCKMRRGDGPGRVVENSSPASAAVFPTAGGMALIQATCCNVCEVAFSNVTD